MEWLDCDRSSCLAWGGIINPGVARAGGSITPTLWMGTLRLSGCRDLVRSQGSEVAEPGGPGLAGCHMPALWGQSPQATGMASFRFSGDPNPGGSG